MVGALGIMTTTIPVIVATYGITKVIDATFRDPKTGKPVGTLHYHRNRKLKRIISHKHTQGHVVHRHTNMMGYGRTKESFKLKR